MYQQGRLVEAQPQRLLGNLISVILFVQNPTGGMTINLDQVTAQNVKLRGVRLFGQKLHQSGEKTEPGLQLDPESAENIFKASRSDLLVQTELIKASRAIGTMGGFAAGLQGKVREGFLEVVQSV